MKLFLMVYLFQAIDDVVREQFMKQREKKMGVKQKDKADTAKAKSSRGNVKRNPEAEDTPLKERKLDLHLVNFQVVGKSLFLLFDVHGCNAHQGEFLLVKISSLRHIMNTML